MQLPKKLFLRYDSSACLIYDNLNGATVLELNMIKFFEFMIILLFFIVLPFLMFFSFFSPRISLQTLPLSLQ